MVKILSNGDIVSDDDPRVKNQSSSRPSSPPVRDGRPTQQPPAAPGNFMDAANQRLRTFGIPTWTLGTFRVEPLVSAALLISLLFLGLPGILLVVIIFFASQLSANNGDWRGTLNQLTGRNAPPSGSPRSPTSRPSTRSPDTSRSPPGGSFTGAGHKLGGK